MSSCLTDPSIDSPLIVVAGRRLAALSEKATQKMPVQIETLNSVKSMRAWAAGNIVRQPALMMVELRDSQDDTLLRLVGLRCRVTAGVVVFSGEPSAFDRRLCLALGANHYVPGLPEADRLGGLVSMWLTQWASRPTKTDNPWKLDSSGRQLLGPDGVCVMVGRHEATLLRHKLQRQSFVLTETDLVVLVFGYDSAFNRAQLQSLSQTLNERLIAAGVDPQSVFAPPSNKPDLTTMLGSYQPNTTATWSNPIPTMMAPGRVLSNQMFHSPERLMNSAAFMLRQQDAPELTLKKLGEQLSLSKSVISWHFNSVGNLIDMLAVRYQRRQFASLKQDILQNTTDLTAPELVAFMVTAVLRLYQKSSHRLRAPMLRYLLTHHHTIRADMLDDVCEVFHHRLRNMPSGSVRAIDRPAMRRLVLGLAQTLKALSIHDTGILGQRALTHRLRLILAAQFLPHPPKPVAHTAPPHAAPELVMHL